MLKTEPNPGGLKSMTVGASEEVDEPSRSKGSALILGSTDGVVGSVLIIPRGSWLMWLLA